MSCVCIYIFMRTYMKYTKDSRNEKQDIQSLFPKSFGHVVVHDNRVFTSNTNATEDETLRGMLVSWCCPSGLHVISSTGWSHPLVCDLPPTFRLKCPVFWNENNTNITSSAAQLIQVLNTSTVTWRVYFKRNLFKGGNSKLGIFPIYLKQFDLWPMKILKFGLDPRFCIGAFTSNWQAKDDPMTTGAMRIWESGSLYHGYEENVAVNLSQAWLLQ